MTDVKDRGTFLDIAEFSGIKEVNKIFQMLFERYILKEYNDREENLFIARKVKKYGNYIAKISYIGLNFAHYGLEEKMKYVTLFLVLFMMFMPGIYSSNAGGCVHD